MTLAIEVRTPSRPVRTRIWQRVFDQTGLNLDADAADRLSSRYLAPPAVAANAGAGGALSGGGEAAVEEAMDGVLHLLGIGPCVPDPDAQDFDPALVNCQDDLARLTERLVRPGRIAPMVALPVRAAGHRQVAICPLSRRTPWHGGHAATGERSPILWVGESEKQIAAAFQTARARRAMLVIDEADSLLSDRREAVRSWEVTQVNEMLTWMESHPLPFVCTTNLMDRLDQASLRRFTLKLRFEPLDPRPGRPRLRALLRRRRAAATRRRANAGRLCDRASQARPTHRAGLRQCLRIGLMRKPRQRERESSRFGFGRR